MFDAKKTMREVIAWIKKWFEENGKDCNAIVGISGGKDSSVVAALCAAALGKERVIGVLMPNGEQHDINVAKQLVEHVGIRNCIINIKQPYEAMMAELTAKLDNVSVATAHNLQPRLRMSTLYAVAQSNNGRVANTCNLSEDWVGYSTVFGDAAGDFSPLANLTVHEVREIGRELGLPAVFVDKVPEDGLCGRSDEDNLGFTYEALDTYLRTGICEDPEIKEKIDNMHMRNKFKLEPMPCFEYKNT